MLKKMEGKRIRGQQRMKLLDGIDSMDASLSKLGDDEGQEAWCAALHGVAKKLDTKMDRFYLLAVQGTLKSLLQHHSSKASILRRSAFFMVQLSHPYMTTGKP